MFQKILHSIHMKSNTQACTNESLWRFKKLLKRRFITSKLKTTAVRPWMKFFRHEPDKYCEAMLEKGEDTMGVSPWFFITVVLHYH